MCFHLSSCTQQFVMQQTVERALHPPSPAHLDHLDPPRHLACTCTRQSCSSTPKACRRKKTPRRSSSPWSDAGEASSSWTLPQPDSPHRACRGGLGRTVDPGKNKGHSGTKKKFKLDTLLSAKYGRDGIFLVRTKGGHGVLSRKHKTLSSRLDHSTRGNSHKRSSRERVGCAALILPHLWSALRR